MNYSWIPFFVISIDQITKRIASFYDNMSKNYYSFIYIQNEVTYNTGISFGLLSNSYYNMLVYAIVIFALFFAIWTWYQTKNVSDYMAWGCIVGGGASNLIDRICFGNVMDFISLSINTSSFGLFSIPNFNFADISITVGAIILAKKLIFKAKSTKNTESK